jgi:alpha-D-ribose 1-methylphosphonate 5-triphosphate synthase subunit PhnI
LPEAPAARFNELQSGDGAGGNGAAPTALSVVDLLRQEGLLEAEPADNGNQPVADLTRQPLQLPAGRDLRLQNLARADEGFLHALAYSALRGFGYGSHPFVGELRVGEVVVEVVPEELGFPIEIGQISITECFMLSRSGDSADACDTFTLGYGLTFGHCERKAMAMSLVDTCLQRAKQEGEVPAPAEDEEFVLYHSDNVEASGFVQHLKLPHYVDFQAELVRMRAERQKADQGEGPSPDGPRAAQR